MTSLALSTASNAVSAWNAKALMPSLGNIDAYISAAHRMPMLTPEEEQQYAKDWQQHQNMEAAGRLVLSHLRLVISTARQYLGYGLPHADLIQEGNVGLMKAVKRFDPAQGVRLVSYALHWIKAEIHEYILKNWRMVKVATTKAQRKLFFNLRSLKASLKSHQVLEMDETSTHLHNELLTAKEANTIAKKLNVKREEVIEMEARFAGGDVLLDPTPTDDDDKAFGPIAYLTDTSMEPTAVIESQERDYLATDGIAKALAGLDARSKRIIEERWLKVNDQGTGGLTLHDLAAEYGVSAERIRQIEVAAMKKMRLALTV